MLVDQVDVEMEDVVMEVVVLVHPGEDAVVAVPMGDVVVVQENVM